MVKTLTYSVKIISILLLTLIFNNCTTKELAKNNFALEAYNEGRYLTAITYANEVLDKEPSNYQAMMIKGKANLKLNNYTEAITDFTEVINNAEEFEPYYYRSRAYLELNQISDADSDLEKAIKYDSENVNALFDLAYVKTLMDDYDSALDVYTAVINIDPYNYKALVNIGNLKGRMGDSESAINYFSRAIAVKPNDAMAYFDRATEKLITNDKQGAIEDLTISVSIDSENVNSLSLLSETMIEIKDYDNAIKYLDKITLKDPQNARAYYLKGTSELAINHKDKACSDLRKSGELGYYDAYELITKNCLQKDKKKSKR
jgi:tetratricopeptide (TPR) repeat protein